ncbi:MAG: hypothetical protein ACO4B3_04620 [Planctomycetota bacterium]
MSRNRAEPGSWIAEIRESGRVAQGEQGLSLGVGGVLLRPGEPLRSRSIVVPGSPIEMTIRVERREDRDGLMADLHLEVRIDPPAGSTGMRLLADAIDGRDRLLVEELDRVLSRLWEPTLATPAAALSWLAPVPLEIGLELSRVPPEVQEALFDRGLRLLEPIRVRASSPELESAREERRRRSEEANRIRERLEFVELWKREEEGEVLAREELARLDAHIEQQGILRRIRQQKEEEEERVRAVEELSLARQRLRQRLERERISAAVEIDREKLDQELERAESLRAAFESHGWLALVHALDGPEERNRFLERLLDKDLTPEQLAARAGGETRVAALEQRLDSLQDRLEQGRTPQGLRPLIADLPATRRVWLAAGLALHRIEGDPAFGEQQARPVLPPEQLGYLRSVRVLEEDGETVIAVGGQGGVGLYRPEGSHWEVYPFRSGERGRLGANAVDFSQGEVVCTHSRLAVTLWDRGAPRSSRHPGAPILVPGTATRAIQRAPEGGWVFSHGAEVLHLDVAGEVRSLGELEESVTSLHGSGPHLWAGTRGGELHARTGTGSWEPLPFRTTGPIYQISSALAQGEDGVRLVGARQPAVHALDPRGEVCGEYRCRYPIRWVGASAGGPLAVDRFGQSLLVWSWGEPDEPLRRIRLADQIHSIAVEAAVGEAGGS